MSFDTLKTGDQVLIRQVKVIVSGGWGTGVTADTYTLQEVTRTTATQFTTEAGRFARRDGCMIGSNAALALPVGQKPVTTPEHLTQLDQLGRSLNVMEKALYNLDRQSKAVVRALGRDGIQPDQFDRVIELVQETTHYANELLKLAKQ